MLKFAQCKLPPHWPLILTILVGTLCLGAYLYLQSLLPPAIKVQLLSTPAPALTSVGEWQEADVIYSKAEDANESSRLQNIWTTKKEIVILRYTKYFKEERPTIILDHCNCTFLESIYWKPARPTSGIFNVPCRVTFDKEYLGQSDTLVFHSRDLKQEGLPKGVRDPKKLWVYLQQESPLYTHLNLKAYNGIFNWTMTYRRDSDVYHPYGHFIKLATSEKLQERERPRNKTGLVAWIVSNCNTTSKRAAFVNELEKYIQVDIFGSCGRQCPEENCYRYIASRYKFYLSLENSLCSEYITEKFFKPLEYEMVPIVYGGSGDNAKDDYPFVSPIHSYIDARSFNSPKELAEYLHHLDRNEEKYMRYFEWRRKYRVVVYEDWHWCNLCQRVYEHLSVNPRPTKWYKNLWKWWNFMKAKPKIITESKPRCVLPPAKLTSDFS